MVDLSLPWRPLVCSKTVEVSIKTKSVRHKREKYSAVAISSQTGLWSDHRWKDVEQPDKQIKQASKNHNETGEVR